MLRPIDFAGLTRPVAYGYDNMSARYRNTSLSSLTFDASFRTGTALNLVPRRGVMPSVADTQRVDLSGRWRPIVTTTPVIVLVEPPQRRLGGPGHGRDQCGGGKAEGEDEALEGHRGDAGSP